MTKFKLSTTGEVNGSWKYVIGSSLGSIAAAIHMLAQQVGRVADALEREGRAA